MSTLSSFKATTDTEENICVSSELLNDPHYTRKTIQIRNNRTLSFSECGNLESHRVVFFHIGLMGSSLITILVHEHALQADLRVIAVDYPGIGDSTLVQDRTLQDWGADVEEFCDQVLRKDQKIMLLGHCLGVPHTLAIWARMMDRVTHITLAAPWVGETKSNPWWMRNFVQKLPMQSYVPSAGAALLGATTYLNYPLSYVLPSELKSFLRAMHEVQTYNRNQGSAGNQEMIRLALSSSSKENFWDPILKEMAEKSQKQDVPIRIYHGTSDAMVSLESSQLLVRWLEEATCQVEFSTIENADHNTILIEPKNMKTILGPFSK